MVLSLPKVLAHQPAFRRFLAASILSGTALQMTRMALVIAVFGDEGTSAAIAGYVFLETVPGALLGPRAGAVSDRISRRTVMIAAELGRACLLLVICMLPNIPVIYAAAALGSILSALHQSARDAHIPALVDQDLVSEANGVDQSGLNAVMVAGPALGTLLYAGVGLAAALSTAGVLFLSSAFLLFRLSVAAPVAINVGQAGRRAGPSQPLRLPRRFWVYLMIFFTGVTASGLWLPFAPEIVEVRLSADPSMIGLLAALCGLGGVVGSPLMPVLMTKISKGWLLVAGGIGEALCIVWFSFSGTLLAAGLAVFVWGVAAAAISTPLYTILHTGIPDANRGEAFGLVRRLDYGGVVLATMIAIVVSGHVPTASVLATAGLMYLAIVLMAAFFLARGLTFSGSGCRKTLGEKLP